MGKRQGLVEQFNLNGSELEIVQEFKYLEVWLSERRGGWSYMQEVIQDKCEKRRTDLARLGLQRNGTNYSGKIWLKGQKGSD